jgi:ATP-dependent DNA ligase
MLAHKFTDFGHELKYPLFVQPKLDGIRCIAVVEKDRVTLWSREQKQITAVPHIQHAINDLRLPAGTVLDGELYNHQLQSDFEKIASCVRKKEPASDEKQKLIEYHVYDLPRHPTLAADAPFAERHDKLNTIFSSNFNPSLVLVRTESVANFEELSKWTESFLAFGYEGAMARANAPYEENKRSHFLQKIKKFDESEFQIVGVEEGVGKMAGMAIFVCQTLDGQEFRCKMEGALDNLRSYLTDESLWKGKMLTVKYQGFTSKNKVPRFPVGKSIRDYE